MSKPIPLIKDKKIEDLNNFNKWHLRTEFTKEFIKLFTDRKPDYLIIDFYGDLFEGVIDLGDGNYITNNSRFSNLSFFKEKKIRLNIIDNTEEYLALWKQKINEFFKLISLEVPNCKIILNKSRFADMFENGESLTAIRKKQGIRFIDVNQLNYFWDIMDNYVIENYNVQVIDLTSKEYKLSSNHPWGSFYVHYTMDFYQDFFNRLVYITMSDLQEESYNIKRKASNLELDNKKLTRKVKFFENETYIHAIKRFLLKNKSIKKLNDSLKKKSFS